jgi:hypothetical protein
VRKSPVLILVSATVLVLAIAAGVWALVQEPPTRSLRLPDGSVLTLKDVSYGKKHPLLERRLWQKLLCRALPLALQGKEVMGIGTPADRLVFWFRPENGPQPWNLGRRVQAIDEHGCRFGSGYESGFPFFAPYRVGILDSFPRRSTTFRVQLFERSASAPAAEFLADNPTPEPHPAWRPEPLPSTRRVGRLTVRLTALEGGLNLRELHTRGLGASPVEREVQAEWAQSERSWASASFRIAADGQPTHAWRLASLGISDATGNTLSYPLTDARTGDIRFFGLKSSTGSGTIRYRAGDASLRWREAPEGVLRAAFPGLCTHEAAWKIRATFSPVGAEVRLPPDLQWDLQGVRVPPPGRARTVTPLADPTGKLRLQGVLGRGAFGTDRPLLPGANVRVIVTSPPADGLALALRARDDRGQPVVCSPGDSTPMGPYRKWWFDLKTAPAANPLTLSFVGWKGRSVEFLARPSVITP